MFIVVGGLHHSLDVFCFPQNRYLEKQLRWTAAELDMPRPRGNLLASSYNTSESAYDRMIIYGSWYPSPSLSLSMYVYCT